MPIYDLFSRRKKRQEQTEPDVYQYDDLPDTLRAQIERIWDDTIGPYYDPQGSYGYSADPPHNNKAWRFIRDTVCREKGLRSLAGRNQPKEDCVNYLLREADVDNLFDLIELSFRYIARIMGKMQDYERNRFGATQSPDDAVEELNFRFREAGVGYQFEGGQILRMDSDLIHTEVVRPALHLLSNPRFAGPQEEFLSAHAHYRAGEYKDCATNALNAFESTMKAICDIRGWEYRDGARSTDLLKVLRAQSFLPDYLDKSFDQLVATLSSGLPTVRNEEGAHGQGAQPKATPRSVAAYALHLAAAKIVLLVETLEGN